MFRRVENEFSHIAVEAPKVNACLKAVSTLGIATRVVWYCERMYFVVQIPSSIGCDYFCVLKNCFATSYSASIIGDCDRSMICLTAVASRNVLLFGSSAASDLAS